MGMAKHYDVAVVGGGPGGTTTATLLKKYRPELSVIVLERERFPREHIGESLLPPVGPVLHEMGCWAEVERAGFPVKVGARFRWGQSPHPWEIRFLPLDGFELGERPGSFAGQRTLTSFQVERARYDAILLAHAERMGCEIRQECPVTDVISRADRIESLKLRNEDEISARYFVDASGNAAILRRALKVRTEVPTRLRNVAFWDYWRDPAWRTSICAGGTLAQVFSLPFGWIWVIPLDPDQASVGLVCPASYFKSAGRTKEDLYRDALADNGQLAALLATATPTGRIRGTKDWSFLAERLYGDNWLLVGEAAGFADPILSAGLSLTHTGAREAAYTLLELFGGQHSPDWLLDHYAQNQRMRIGQHIRFAEYFYAANGQFSRLKEECSAIAEEAGLSLDPESAWSWLAQGGFAIDSSDRPAVAGLDLDVAKIMTQQISSKPAKWRADGFNEFHLRLEGAQRTTIPIYREGRVRVAPCLRRGRRVLPMTGMFGLVVQVLRNATTVEKIIDDLVDVIPHSDEPAHSRLTLRQALQVLEVLVSEGWVEGRIANGSRKLRLSAPSEIFSAAAPELFVKRKLAVNGRSMAYIEVGTGDPIVFLHGNPTSSYLWRNVLPEMTGLGRCIAPDLIGMGDSDRILDGGHSGGFMQQRYYLEAFLRAVGADSNVTFVMHDWGSALGFDWANRHREAVRGLAFMEAVVQPFASSDFARGGREMVDLLRGPGGEQIVLWDQGFVARTLAVDALVSMSKRDVAAYEAHFAAIGESRRAILSLIRDIPIDGEPRDVAQLVEDYARWLAVCPVPKLLIDAHPGRILTDANRDACRRWPGLTRASVRAGHLVPEDAPESLIKALQQWLLALQPSASRH